MRGGRRPLQQGMGLDDVQLFGERSPGIEVHLG